MTAPYTRFGLVERITLFGVLLLVTTFSLLTTMAYLTEHASPMAEFTTLMQVISWVLMAGIVLLCFGRPVWQVLRWGYVRVNRRMST